MEETQKEEIKSKSRSMLVYIVAGLVVVIALFGLGYYFLTPTPVETDAVDTVVSNEIVISASEFKFNPQEIKIKAGEKIQITFKNNGKMRHDLVFEGGEFKTNSISGGESQTIEVVFSELGEYVFYF